MQHSKRGNLHQTPLILLYLGPRREINFPKMIKFAAIKGVGAMIVVVILIRQMSRVSNRRMVETHWIINGVMFVGFLLDHRRPLQPMTSVIPAMHAVGMSHHILKRNAWPK